MKKALTRSTLIMTLIGGTVLFCLSLGTSASNDKGKQPESPSDSISNQACLDSFFTKSLHYTGEGMRYWYEEEGGFMNITGIPYKQLGCKSCHAESCDACHAVKKGGAMHFSLSKTQSMDTCTACHTREKLAFAFDRQKSRTGVHINAGMVCADCHHGSDVHGDGIMRSSMRSPGAVQTDCKTCHKAEVSSSPGFDPKTKSHQIHGPKLDCAACHVRSTMACLNCHFDTYLETGEKQGNFIPAKEWTLLINYNGRVTSGSVMTLVYKDKKFIAYVPYYTHSVMAEGRQCDACHMNKAVQKIKQGESVSMMSYEEGKLRHWSGVVPVIPERLKWLFLNKSDSGWEPVPNDQEPMVQFAAYGKPLTEKQLSRLKMKFSGGNRR